MDKNYIVIKGSFKGIIGKLSKRIGILILFFILAAAGSQIKSSALLNAGVKSIKDFDLSKMMDKPFQSVIIVSVYILYAILIILSIPLIYRIISLFYEVYKKVVIDYSKGSIVTESYFFPFQKITEENKFDDIIEVEVYQNVLDKLFVTGNLYIEYVACNKVDSKLKYVEIKYVLDPFSHKGNLI